jgi:hypothetical protein
MTGSTDTRNASFIPRIVGVALGLSSRKGGSSYAHGTRNNFTPGLASNFAPRAAHVALIIADVLMPLQAVIERIHGPRLPE